MKQQRWTYGQGVTLYTDLVYIFNVLAKLGENGYRNSMAKIFFAYLTNLMIIKVLNSANTCNASV